MICVHVIRKPLSEGNVASNVLKWGTGALNIKASKIAYPSGKPESGWAKSGSKGEEGFLGESNFRIREMSAEEIQARVSDGRWPANLILQHLPGCRHVGVQKVKGTGPRPGGSGPRFKDPGSLMSREGHEGARTEHQGFADPDGTEDVPKWECVHGCPVADMDGISGIRASGTGAVKKSSAAEQQGNKGAAYGAENRPAGTPMISHGDKGGASRFFKQVQSKE